jgi:hypothetical protein
LFVATTVSRTEWHRVALWGKLAEAAAKLAKGAHVEIEGESIAGRSTRVDSKASSCTRKHSALPVQVKFQRKIDLPLATYRG